MDELEDVFQRIAELQASLHNSLANKVVTVYAGNRVSTGRVLWVSDGEIEMMNKEGKVEVIPISTVERVKRRGTETHR